MLLYRNTDTIVVADSGKSKTIPLSAQDRALQAGWSVIEML